MYKLAVANRGIDPYKLAVKNEELIRVEWEATMPGHMLEFQMPSLLGGVPREQKMLKGHLPKVIYHQVY